MNAFWKKLSQTSLILILLFALSACYEGWSKKGKGAPGTGPTTVSSPTPKIIYHILFEPIFLDPQAMNNPKCFLGSKANITYRMNETVMRIEALKQGLETLAERVTVSPLMVTESQCTTALEVLTRAKTPLNEGSGLLPSSPDKLGRKTIHLKAVFWEKDIMNISPDDNVKSRHWPEMKKLIEKGYSGVKSLHYFYITNFYNQGFFYTWSNALPWDAKQMEWYPISYPDPSEAGLETRNKTIIKNTEVILEWISYEATIH